MYPLPVVLLLLVSMSDCIENEKRINVILPIPIEMPNREDKHQQCWLRIEDLEVTETVSIYCYGAHDFLKYHLYEYNKNRMMDDGVALDLWNEEAKPQEDSEFAALGAGRIVRDWRSTTVLDPTVHHRIYVTQSAYCKILIYSRESLSNFKVDCDKVLFYLNSLTSGAISRSIGLACVVFSIIFLIL